MSPDIVYICRPGDDNEELRHSLRSLKHLPHSEVWIVGDGPSWLQNVNRLPVTWNRDKQVSALNNLISAIHCPDISDPFLIFNDDFYIMQPMDEVPVLHDGDLLATIEGYRPGASYRNAAQATYDRLLEIEAEGPLYSYELHIPMLIEKLGMMMALSLGQGIHGLHNRTMYGNLMQIGGQESEDFKIYRTEKARGYIHWPLLSTSDRTFKFHPAGRYVRESFPEASPYEKPLRVRPRSRATRYSSVVVRP
jgi:hypothetical protein